MPSKIHFKIKRFKSLPSTNVLAKQMAREGATEGLVLVADHQTAGYGKLGRKWISPSGKNLLCSILLRPPMSPQEAPLLTQIICRSVASVLKSKYGITSTFKRPNDILVQGKKICGVLIEAISKKQHELESVVIGIGLNVNADPTELIPEATSVLGIKGRSYVLKSLLKSVLTQIGKDLEGIYAHRI